MTAAVERHVYGVLVRAENILQCHRYVLVAKSEDEARKTALARYRQDVRDGKVERTWVSTIGPESALQPAGGGAITITGPDGVARDYRQVGLLGSNPGGRTTTVIEAKK